MKKLVPIVIVGLLILCGIGASGLSEKTNFSEKEDEYDMVVIAPDEFTSQVQLLIDHKNSIDVQTFLKTTDDIYQEFDGRDKPEQIKYFIKYAIETYNISNVLIIGGLIGNTLEWYVPVRYVELDDGAGQGNLFISDLYYADIYKNGDEFEDWDKNGDDIIAQWPKDKFNLIPDVNIGRLPCRTINEVSSVVEKIISYETNTYGQSWFNNMVFVAGDTFPDFEGYEGEITCDYASEYMQGFDILKLYYSTGAISSSTEVINAINSGCGFFFTRAKGGFDRIRVPRSDGTEIIALHNDDIDDFTNKDEYPVMILAECQHGQFDRLRTKSKTINTRLKFFQFPFIKLLLSKILKIKSSSEQQPTNQEIPLYSKKLNECIAWKLVNKEDAGGIAVLTNTHICYATIGDTNQNDIPDDVEQFGGFLAVELLRLFNEEDVNILGELHYKSVENYVLNQPVTTNKIHCKSVQEWILIGDPSLKIGGIDK